MMGALPKRFVDKVCNRWLSSPRIWGGGAPVTAALGAKSGEAFSSIIEKRGAIVVESSLLPNGPGAGPNDYIQGEIGEIRGN